MGDINRLRTIIMGFDKVKDPFAIPQVDIDIIYFVKSKFKSYQLFDDEYLNKKKCLNHDNSFMCLSVSSCLNYGLDILYDIFSLREPKSFIKFVYEMV